MLPATPTPTPSIPPTDFTAATVTPGLPGFFVFLFMAVVLLLLLLDMSRRIRRSTARENVRRRIQERAAEAAAAGDGRVEAGGLGDAGGADDDVADGAPFRSDAGSTQLRAERSAEDPGA